MRKTQRQAVTDYMNQLHIIQTDGEMQGCPCSLYFGYFVDTETLFETFAPLAQEVMASVLKDMTVITHLYPMQQTPPIQESETKLFADFLVQVQGTIEKGRTHRVCRNGSNDAAGLFHITKGVDTKLLRHFYSSPVSYSYENYLYGFYENPLSSLFGSATSIENFLNTTTCDILCSYHRFHVGLTIYFNSTVMGMESVMQTILEVCKRHEQICTVDD